MVAIVSGNALGLTNNPTTPRGDANVGLPRQSDQVYINSSTGNLVIQQQDEYISTVGPDIPILRTYNSLGTVDGDNNDNWRLGFSRSLRSLPLTANAVGSKLTKVYGDGTETEFDYDTTRGLYVSIASDEGARDTLTFTGSQWIWTDGTPNVQEIYTVGGQLQFVRDADNNITRYFYDSSGFLNQITSATGEYTFLDRGGANVVGVRVSTPNGVQQTLTRYFYDSSNRLRQVLVDLTPVDNVAPQVDSNNDGLFETVNGQAYVTTYTYDGASKRVASITAGDGATVSFSYDASGRVKTYTDSEGKVTTFNYVSATQTDLTDPLGLVTSYTFDAQGRILQLQTPAVGGTRLTTVYRYDGANNLTGVTDANGNVTTIDYDTRGNVIRRRDASGNTVEYTYTPIDANNPSGLINQLLTETHYLTPDPDGFGTALPSNPLTTRYAYDGENHLRFVITGEGRVTEHRYDTPGNRTSTIVYTGGVYSVAGLSPSTPLSESQLQTWLGTQDKTRTARTDYAYDFRGNPSGATTYGQTDTTGAGVAGTASITHFVYDQRGQLLQTIDARSSSVTPNAANPNLANATTYLYDGLGRVVSTTQWVENGSTRTTQTAYDNINRKTTVTLANGLVTTSTYDKRGLLLNVVQTASNIATSTTTYQYDADGRLRVVTDPLTNKSYSLYDAAGRVIATIDAVGAMVESVYDAAGNVIKKIARATLLNQSQLAIAGDLTKNVSLADIALAASVQNDRIARYIYDDANRLAMVIESSDFNSNAGFVTLNVYDGAGRLTDAIHYATGIFLGGLPPIPKVADVTPKLRPDPSIDRRTRSFYDGDGNLRGTLDGEGGLCEYIYDSAGRMIHAIHYAMVVPEAARAAGTLDLLRGNISGSGDDQHTYNFYNAKGQVVATLDAENYLTEFLYDAAGNKTQETRYANKANTYVVGKTVADLRPATTDKDIVTATIYNGANQVVQVTETPLYAVTNYSYDNVGRLVRTDRSGFATGMRYDAKGRLIGELTGAGVAKLNALPTNATQSDIDGIWKDFGLTHAYDAADRRISTTDERHHKTVFYYDAMGRLRYTINALGEVTETIYNAFGDAIDRYRYGTRLSNFSTLAGGATNDSLTTTITNLRNAALDSHEQNGYNMRDLLRASTTSLSAADTATTSYSYNAFKQVSNETLPANAGGTSPPNTKYVYDRRGLLSTTTRDSNVLNIQTTNGYDAFGRAIQTIDGKGIARTFGYDRLGRLTATATDPGADPAHLNVGTRTTYDAFGRVLTQTVLRNRPGGNSSDPKDEVTTYEYFDLYKAYNVTTPTSGTTSVYISALRQPVLVFKPDQSLLVHQYDANGNEIGLSEGHGLFSTVSKYDPANRLTDTIDANGVVTHYEYDEANRLISRTVDPGTGTDTDTDRLNLVTSYKYDAKGQLTQTTDPSGNVTTFTYDLKGEKLTVTVDPDGLQLTTVYTYDKRGNALTVTEGANTDDTRKTQYVYDNLDRLIQKITDPDGANALKLTCVYAYDASNNIISKTEGTGAETRVTRYGYDSANRLVYTLDAMGAVVENRYDRAGNITVTIRYANAIASPGAGVTDLTAYIRSLPSFSSALDNVTRYAYDNENHLVFTVDAIGGLTENQYYAGNLIRQTRYANPLPSNGSPTFATDALSVETIYGLINNSNVFVRDAQHDETTRTYYDILSRPIYRMDALGYVTLNIYDNNGNVITRVAYANAISSPEMAWDLGQIQALLQGNPARDRYTRTVYDAANRAIYAIDAMSNVTETVYTGAGQVAGTIRYASALPSSTPMTAKDVRETIADLADTTRDEATLYQYDGAGRIIQTTDAEGFSEYYDYDAVGNKIAFTNKNGAGDPAYTWTYGYDKAGRLLTETTPPVLITRLTPSGDAVMSAAQEPIVTAFAYDTLGNVLTKTEASGAPEQRTTGYTYDLAGRQIRTTFPAASIYDAGADRTANYLNRNETASQSPISNTYYNSLGQAFASKDVRGSVSYKVFDVLGRVRYEIDAERFVTEYSYDAFGNQLTLTRHANPLAETAFASREGSGGTMQPFSIGDVGSLIGNAGADRTVSNTYDRMNRLFTTQQPQVYSFDSSAVGDAQTFTASPTTTNFYNAFGQLVRQSALRNPGTTPIANIDTYFYYNVRGDKTGQIDGKGYLTTYEYDAFGNLSRQTEYARALSSTTGTPQQGQYNADTYVTPLASNPANGASVSLIGFDRTTAFSYDRLNHKTADTKVNVQYADPNYGGIVSVTSKLGNLSTRYGYDALGNMTSVSDPSGAATYTYYDVLGRTTAIAAPARTSEGTSASLPVVSVNSFSLVVGTASHAEWHSGWTVGNTLPLSWNSLDQWGDGDMRISLDYIAGHASGGGQKQVNFTKTFKGTQTLTGVTLKWGAKNPDDGAEFISFRSVVELKIWKNVDGQEVLLFDSVAATNPAIDMTQSSILSWEKSPTPGAIVKLRYRAADLPSTDPSTRELVNGVGGLIATNGSRYWVNLSDVANGRYAYELEYINPVNGQTFAKGNGVLSLTNNTSVASPNIVAYVDTAIDANNNATERLILKGNTGGLDRVEIPDAVIATRSVVSLGNSAYAVDVRDLPRGNYNYKPIVIVNGITTTMPGASFTVHGSPAPTGAPVILEEQLALGVTAVSAKLVNGAYSGSSSITLSWNSLAQWGAGNVHVRVEYYKKNANGTTSALVPQDDTVSAAGGLTGYFFSWSGAGFKKISRIQVWKAVDGKEVLLFDSTGDEFDPKLIVSSLPDNVRKLTLEYRLAGSGDAYQSKVFTQLTTSTGNWFGASYDDVSNGAYEYRLTALDSTSAPVALTGSTGTLKILRGGQDLPVPVSAIATRVLTPLTAFEHDVFGNVVRQVAYAKGATNANAANFFLVGADNANDEITYNSYDQYGRLVRSMDAEGVVTERSYDAAGNVVKQWLTVNDADSPTSNAHQKTTLFEYDRLGRQTATTQVTPLIINAPSFAPTITSIRFGTLTTGPSSTGGEFGFNVDSSMTFTWGAPLTAYNTIPGEIRIDVDHTVSDFMGGTHSATASQTFAQGNILLNATVTWTDESVLSVTGVTGVRIWKRIRDQWVMIGASPIGSSDKRVLSWQPPAVAGVTATFKYRLAGSNAAWGSMTLTTNSFVELGSDFLDGRDYEYLISFTDASGAKFVNQRGIIRNTLWSRATELNRQEARYNSFGEIVAKGVNGDANLPLQEYFDYDNAGRLWRTNQGDGVDKVTLYDLQGRATAKIVSRTLDLKSYAGPAAVTGADASALERTNIVYDALGRIFSETKPSYTQASSPESIAAKATVSAFTATAGSPLSFASYNSSTGWLGQNSVVLTWSSLAAWGDGDVQVTIGYDGINSAGAHAAASVTQSFAGGVTSVDGVVVRWGGVRLDHVTGFSVSKKVGAELLTLFDSAAATQTYSRVLSFDLAPVQDTNIVLSYQASSGTSSTMGGGPLKRSGRTAIFGLGGLAVGASFDYRIELRNPVDNVRYQAGNGSFQNTDGWQGSVGQPAALAAVQVSSTLMQTVDRWGNVARAYDPRRTSAALSAQTLYYYDYLNHVIQQTSPLTDVWDEAGNLNRLQPITRFYYDAAGRLVATSAPAPTSTPSYYNGKRYDEAGQLIGEFGDSSLVKHRYDALGREVERVDADNNATQYVYDRNNRQRTEIAAANSDAQGTTTYAYDRAGNRISSTNGESETTRYYYDDNGKVTMTRLPDAAINTFTADVYDMLGHKIAEANTLGDTQAWGYDYFGHLLSSKDLGGAVTTYTYDEAGRLLTQTRTGGVNSGQNLSYQYYENGAIKRIVDVTLQRETYYEYDKAGNRTRERFAATDASAEVFQDTRLFYDELGRLAGMHDGGTDTRYDYDIVGNRRRIYTGYLDADGMRHVQDNWYSYDRMNRILVSQGVLRNGEITTVRGNGQDGFNEDANWSGLADVGNDATREVFVDVNNDGRIDLVNVRSGTGAGIYVYLNDGQGGFVTAPAWTGLSTLNLDPTRYKFVDVDNDGWVDLVYVNPNNGVQVYLNDRQGGFNTTPFWTGFSTGSDLIDGGNPTGQFLLDVNGDGLVDLVSINGKVGLRVFLNDGQGRFNSPVLTTFTAAVPSADPRRYRFTDVNGDGLVDLMYIHTNANGYIYLNNGQGRFSNTGTVNGLTIGGDPIHHILADINGDGLDDIVAVSDTKGMFIYLNNGNGLFSSAPPVLANLGPDINRYHFMDVNGDGRLDLVYLAAKGGSIYLNDGNGSFLTTPYWTGLTGVPSDTNAADQQKFVDVDGDGRLDWVYISAGVSIYLMGKTQGVKLEYDAAGNRKTATSYEADSGSKSIRQIVESYTYDGANRLADTNRGGAQTSTRRYDKAGRVILYQGYTSTGAPAQRREYAYNDNGWLLTQKNFDGTAASTTPPVISIAYNYSADSSHPASYDAMGNLMYYTVDDKTLIPVSGDTITRRVYHYTYDPYFKLSSYRESTIRGRINTTYLSARAANPDTGTSSSSYDTNGNLILVLDTRAHNKKRDFVVNTQGLILRKIEGKGTNDEQTQLYYYADGKPVGDKGELSPANFDYNYTPVSQVYPGLTPTTFVVNSGDTLKSISFAVYGDPSLWYLIADANGIKDDEDLKTFIGQTITIPNHITNIHNSADTSKVYNPKAIIGDTTPTLPIPPPPPDSGGGCGVIGMILVAIVSVVVAWLAPYALGPIIGPLLSAVAGPAFAEVATPIVVGAASAALSNVAGQLTGIALGVQSKFSWGSVATSTLSAGVAAGLGEFFPVPEGGIAGAIGVKNGIAQAVVNGAIMNALNQGINIVTGQQEQFSWSGVALAGAAAGAVTWFAGTPVGSALKGLAAKNGGSSFNPLGVIGDAGYRIATGVISQAIPNHGRVDWAGIATDAFGNALGNSIVGQLKDVLKATTTAPVSSTDDVTSGAATSAKSGAALSIPVPEPIQKAFEYVEKGVQFVTAVPIAAKELAGGLAMLPLELTVGAETMALFNILDNRGGKPSDLYMNPIQAVDRSFRGTLESTTYNFDHFNEENSSLGASVSRLLNAFPVVGRFLDAGPSPTTDAQVTALFASPGLHQTVDGTDSAWLAEQNGGTSVPYPVGTFIDTLFGALNLNNGMSAHIANFVSDRVNAGSTVDLIGHSGGVQLVAGASSYLGDIGIGVNRLVGVEGPAMGFYNNARSITLMGNAEIGPGFDSISAMGRALDALGLVGGKNYQSNFTVSIPPGYTVHATPSEMHSYWLKAVQDALSGKPIQHAYPYNSDVLGLDRD